MIPVQKQIAPECFKERVAEPGKEFLRNVPQPRKKEWKKHAYWRRALDDLHEEYDQICSYGAIWCPRDSATVDHFVPKSARPRLAYDWGNFRLASRSLNLNKGVAEVADPFTLKPDSFVLEFILMNVKPGPGINCAAGKSTIEALGLNDKRMLDYRYQWLLDYCSRAITYDYLVRKAPFIAYELERQGRKETILDSVKIPKPKKPARSRP